VNRTTSHTAWDVLVLGVSHGPVLQGRSSSAPQFLGSFLYMKKVKGKVSHLQSWTAALYSLGSGSWLALTVVQLRMCLFWGSAMAPSYRGGAPALPDFLVLFCLWKR